MQRSPVLDCSPWMGPWPPLSSVTFSGVKTEAQVHPQHMGSVFYFPAWILNFAKFLASEHNSVIHQCIFKNVFLKAYVTQYF